MTTEENIALAETRSPSRVIDLYSTATISRAPFQLYPSTTLEEHKSNNSPLDGDIISLSLPITTPSGEAANIPRSILTNCTNTFFPDAVDSGSTSSVERRRRVVDDVCMDFQQHTPATYVDSSDRVPPRDSTVSGGEGGHDTSNNPREHVSFYKLLEDWSDKRVRDKARERYERLFRRHIAASISASQASDSSPPQLLTISPSLLMPPLPKTTKSKRPSKKRKRPAVMSANPVTEANCPPSPKIHMAIPHRSPSVSPAPPSVPTEAIQCDAIMEISDHPEQMDCSEDVKGEYKRDDDDCVDEYCPTPAVATYAKTDYRRWSERHAAVGSKIRATTAGVLKQARGSRMTAESSYGPQPLVNDSKESDWEENNESDNDSEEYRPSCSKRRKTRHDVNTIMQSDIDLFQGQVVLKTTSLDDSSLPAFLGPIEASRIGKVTSADLKRQLIYCAADCSEFKTAVEEKFIYEKFAYSGMLRDELLQNQGWSAEWFTYRPDKQCPFVDKGGVACDTGPSSGLAHLVRHHVSHLPRDACYLYFCPLGCERDPTNRVDMAYRHFTNCSNKSKYEWLTEEGFTAAARNNVFLRLPYTPQVQSIIAQQEALGFRGQNEKSLWDIQSEVQPKTAVKKKSRKLKAKKGSNRTRS